MGQTSSGERVPEWAEVQRHAATFKELAFLSYEHFVSSLKELNRISHTFTDANGKRLIFAVKRGTDSTVLWKATVKVGCVKVDAETKQIESYRLLNLKQYLQVYRLIMCQVISKNQSAIKGDSMVHNPSRAPNPENGESAESDQVDNLQKTRMFVCGTLGTPLTTSMILDKVTTADFEHPVALDECCICMERKPEVILPCAHNYCVPCIEQWNVTNKTCPVCREEVDSTNDSWVISEAPDSSEMAAEVQKLLNELAESSNMPNV